LVFPQGLVGYFVGACFLAQVFGQAYYFPGDGHLRDDFHVAVCSLLVEGDRLRAFYLENGYFSFSSCEFLRVIQPRR
jgi:hypothetical protein